MNMKFYLVVLLSVLGLGNLCAQTYNEEIVKYRTNYIKALTTEHNPPVKPADARYIHFFEPNVKYKVNATLTEIPGSKPIMLPTHSGKNKPFKEYGIVKCTINDTAIELHGYQMLNLLNNSIDNNDLFIPFFDATNYDFTYGGGRYLDIPLKEIKDGILTIDFNKCYNPYCAYGDGYSCPIPPEENRLHISIKAGEKIYSKFLGK